MASAHNQYSFVPDPHTTEYLAMNHSHNHRSPSPRRKFWPFNRSRSSSPNTNAQPNLTLDTSFNTTRSRKSSANSQNAVSPSGSATSFVVRSVVRNPGGVSLPTSPANERSQPFSTGQSRQQSSSPGARRMTLEDSDDDVAQPAPQPLQYRRSKSKPLGAATSLGVPPGGPGGGVGYGTARSSNDGRPESANAERPSPYYRPTSPSGSITAGDFHRGANQRGRSPRKSGSAQGSSDGHADHASHQSRSGSAQSAASSSSNNNAKKPVARITAGPKSLAQKQQEEEHHRHHAQFQHHQQQHPSSRGPSPAAARPAGLSGPRQLPAGPPSPSAPGYHPQSHSHQHPMAPRNHSSGPPGMDQRAKVGFPLLPPQHSPAHESRDDSPSRSRRFSFGIGRSRNDSDAALQQPNVPGTAPLNGIPSPVQIPYGRSPHSPLRHDAGADTDYSRANSPFGSVSPARVAASPNSSGFLSTLMGKQAAEERESKQQQQQRQHDQVPLSCSPGGGANLAGKWFKGVFGRSPRGDEKDPNYASDLSVYPFGNGARDAEDEAAYAQKLASMRQARHIVDEERQRHFMGASTPTSSGQRFEPNQDREFRPRQVVDSDPDDGEDEGLDAALEFELGRKQSPPGRKPVPAYLPGANKIEGDESKHDSVLQGGLLTPAQRIIHETRSKQLAREQIQAQRNEAIIQQQKIANPRETVAANAQFNGPPTPPKSKGEPPLDGHQPRFPSGAHQITREPAKGGVAPIADAATSPAGADGASGQRKGSTLSPGDGPMPADLPLRDALQEMMIRFYRFERYSVPLIRSLETRLLDIERDAMLANNPQARKGTSTSIASNHSSEMDRWVNQMSSLMKHEVAQLKAATREIKEARELVANVARNASTATAGVGLSMSVSSFGSVAAITPSASLQQVSKPAVEARKVGKVRETNVSSSTFESAVPRNNVGLPTGAKPVLGKDEGKHAGIASPTKAIFGFASESAKELKENSHSQARDRSVSPNGRPRYTSVLGQPLAKHDQGRLSPGPLAGHEAQAGIKNNASVQDRLKALMEGAESRSRSSSFASASASTPLGHGEQQAEEAADKSGSSDIAAALAAIDASSTVATAQHEKKISEQTLRQQHVGVTKSTSNSSSNSGSVHEPLTPTVEVGAEPITLVANNDKCLTSRNDVSQGVKTRVRALSYLTTDEPRSKSNLSSPTNMQFGATVASSPTVSSGRISPNKLFAHKFAANGSTGSTHSVSSGSPSASAKLGLVEKKRFTLPAPSSTQPVAMGVVTTVPARQGGKLSRTPSYSLDDATAPTSAAFSGLTKVKAVGHTATLKERVAFFDAAK